MDVYTSHTDWITGWIVAQNIWKHQCFYTTQGSILCMQSGLYIYGWLQLANRVYICNNILLTTTGLPEATLQVIDLISMSTKNLQTHFHLVWAHLAPVSRFLYGWGARPHSFSPNNVKKKHCLKSVSLLKISTSDGWSLQEIAQKVMIALDASWWKHVLVFFGCSFIVMISGVGDVFWEKQPLKLDVKPYL